MLRTKRLTLRAPVRSDAPDLTRLYKDRDVRRYLGGPAPDDRIAAIVTSLMVAHSDRHVWRVGLQADDQCLGLVYLAPYRDPLKVELSYQFLPEAWGVGYATEACKAVLSFAQTDLVAETQTANTASIRLLTRLGFQETAQFERFGALQSVFAYSTAPVST